MVFAGFDGTNWVVCHTLDGGRLFPILLQIAEFLERHPQEVLAVELTHIYNAEAEQRRVLRKMLERVLGRWLDTGCRCAPAAAAAHAQAERQRQSHTSGAWIHGDDAYNHDRLCLR